jgi:hypothetical protein
MRIMKKMLIVLPFMLFAWAACDKEKDPKIQTVSEMLQAGPWNMNATGWDQNHNNTVDPGETISAEACEADDTYNYQAGGILKVNNNALKCDPDDPAGETFIWSLSNNDTVLNWEMNGETANFSIIKITPNSLVLGMDFGGELIFLVYVR